MRFLICVLALIAAATGSAFAQTPPPAVSWDAAKLPQVKPVQVTLTPDLMERFIASLPDLLRLARDLDRENGRAEAPNLDDNFAFLLVPYLFDPAIERRVSETLQGFGFASYSDWANVAHSVALAVEAVGFTGTIDLRGQEDAARSEIENDSRLSAEEKAKALEELQSQFSALAEFEPLPGNREVAAPYLERLHAATAAH